MDSENTSAIEDVFAGGLSQRVGRFRFYFADDRWEWSREVQQIHGYEPGTVSPTTRLVLSHKHPDDYEQIAKTLEDIRRTHKPFSTRHRIITVQGDVRDVVIIGEHLHEGGEIVGAQGFYIDVTNTDRNREAAISQAVTKIADHRAAIEQVKGVLMFVYRISADDAFELLRWRSQENNVKLRHLAEQFMTDIGALPASELAISAREAFDRLLLTTHERIIND